MFAFLTAIPGLLSGLFSTVNGITQAISNEKIALINATTDREKIEIGERIAALNAQRDALVAESAKSNWPIWIQSFMGGGVAGYVVVTIFWDKVVGKMFGCVGETAPGTCSMFTTDDLNPHQWYLVYVIVGFYFIHAIVGTAKS